MQTQYQPNNPTPAYPPYAPQQELYGQSSRLLPRAANFGARMVAFLLDGLILSAIEGVILGTMAGFALMFGYLAGKEEAFVFGIGAYVMPVPVVTLVAFLYYIKSETG